MDLLNKCKITHTYRQEKFRHVAGFQINNYLKQDF